MLGQVKHCFFLVAQFERLFEPLMEPVLLALALRPCKLSECDRFLIYVSGRRWRLESLDQYLVVGDISKVVGVAAFDGGRTRTLQSKLSEQTSRLVVVAICMVHFEIS